MVTGLAPALHEVHSAAPEPGPDQRDGDRWPGAGANQLVVVRGRFAALPGSRAAQRRREPAGGAGAWTERCAAGRAAPVTGLSAAVFRALFPYRFCRYSLAFPLAVG